MDPEINKIKINQWRDLILAARNSGMTVDEWCAANNISHHAYYYWLRKIRRFDATEMSSQGTNLIPKANAVPAEFVEMPLLSNKQPAADPTTEQFSCQMMLQAGQYRLYIGSNISSNVLTQVLRGIANA